MICENCMYQIICKYVEREKYKKAADNQCTIYNPLISKEQVSQKVNQTSHKRNTG